MDLDGALSYLDAHINLETDPSARAAATRLDRVQHLVELMGDPQRAYPVVHLTGTNGKGSVCAFTASMLRAQGAAIDVGGGIIVLDPPDKLEPLNITVPGDPSSAAFFACLAALSDAGSITIRDVGLNPGRCGFINVLKRMGARIDIVDRNDSGAEPLGDMVVRPVHLSATRIDGDEVPSLIDELPALACVAARAHGETVISGAAELRVKESDRIAAVVANLRNVGVDVDEAPDGMRIRGTREPLSGKVETHLDHRLAMAFGILGCSAQTELHIDHPECVAVSYPEFWKDLAHVVV